MDKNSANSQRISLNFDLFQDKLRQEGFVNPLDAYEQLGKELKSLGYEKRQQSSWITIQSTNINNVIEDFYSLQRNTNIYWFSNSVKHITATYEDAILDLMPYFTKRKSLKNEYDKQNIPKIKDRRAIHFDLSMKKVDREYPYRAKPYYEIKREMTKLGFIHQQGSGYISKDELTPDDFAYVVQTIKQNIPKLKDVVKHVDATQLSSVWDLMEYINPNYKPKIDDSINYINPDTLKAESKDKLTQNELLQLNMHVRHKEIDPDVLINKKFDYDNEEYQIKSIDVLDNGKDNVILERTSDGINFKEEDFASLPDFKLHYGKEAQKAPIKQKSNEKIKI